jgi:hypothetical protein
MPVPSGCLIRSRNCLTSASTWVHPSVFWWGPCCSSFYFLCCPIMRLYVLCFALWCQLRYPHKNDGPRLFVAGLMSFSVLFCVCLLILMSNIWSFQISLRHDFHVVMSATIHLWKRCSVCLYLLLSVGGFMSYIR